jgi:HAT1-interacting factor 1
VNHKFHFGGDDPDDDEPEEEDDEAEADEESVEDLLETAFQMLDIARTIYEKQKEQSEATQQKIADVHRLLGDVATESGELPAALGPCFLTRSH